MNIDTKNRDAERKAFERWAAEHGFLLARDAAVGDLYDSLATQRAWFVWQARAALAQEVAS